MSNIERYNESSSAFCSNCHTLFSFKPDETFWDDKGTSYSTKLTTCKKCGKIVVLHHKEDYGFSFMNTDKRYF